MKIDKMLRDSEELTIGEFYERVFGNTGTPYDYANFCTECQLNRKLIVEQKVITRGASTWECYVVRKKV